MKHLFITVLLIILLATPAAASSVFSSWGSSGSGWGEEPTPELEEEIAPPAPEVTPEVTPEEEPAPGYGITPPNTGQFLFDNGYAPSPSGFGEPEITVDPPVEESVATVEAVKEVEVIKEIIVVEKVIYEPVYIEKKFVDNMQWWHTMEAPAKEKVEEKPVVKGISTPDTGGGGLFWLGLAAVILGVAIVVRLEGRGE